MRGLICLLLTLYLLVVLGTIILSWFPTSPDSALASVHNVLRKLTDPVLGPLRRTIPPVRLGSVALDLSPIIVLVGIQILSAIICP